MAKEITARGTVKTDDKGRYMLDIPNPHWFQGELSKFEPGTAVVISVKKYYKRRSLKQNDFYWGIFVQQEIECFQEYWGETYSKQEVHDWNKSMFWGEEKVIDSTGEVIRTPASSTVQSTLDWEEKLETARQWFRQNFNWEINYPGDQGDFNFK